MVKLKFLVTGSAGLVGQQVVKDLTKSHQVFSCYNESKPEYGDSVKMDLKNYEMISSVLTEIKPDVVIHLGAMTGVDICEKEKTSASEINTKATEIIAKECSKLNSFLVYVSTDYVFDGNFGMYKEDDVTNPLGFYGKSKLEGEKIEVLVENKLKNQNSYFARTREMTPVIFESTSCNPGDLVQVDIISSNQNNLFGKHMENKFKAA